MVTRAKWFRQPDGLSETAKIFWFRHGPALLAAGLLHGNSIETFRNLCELLAAARIASAEIERFGVTVETAAGGRKSNPAVTALVAFMRAAAPLLEQFEMTVSNAD